MGSGQACGMGTNKARFKSLPDAFLLQLPADLHPGRQQETDQTVDPCYPHGRPELSSWLLASTWGCCSHLGNEAANRFLSLCMSLCLSSKKINLKKNKFGSFRVRGSPLASKSKCGGEEQVGPTMENGWGFHRRGGQATAQAEARTWERGVSMGAARGLQSARSPGECEIHPGELGLQVGTWASFHSQGQFEAEAVL